MTQHRDLSRVDLNLLLALDALLIECNVTRAAERTMVGQPAMSASLARLRAHFGDPLLVREGRRLRPTPLAESLAGPVRDAVLAVETAMGARASFDPAKDQRSFTIVASDYVTLVLLRHLFARICLEAPGVIVTVAPITPDFPDLLRRGQVDMVIVPAATIEDTDLPSCQLFVDRYLIAADRDNPDVRDDLRPEDIAELSFLSFRVGPLRSLGEAELDSLGIRRRVEVHTQSFVISALLIAGTSLVALVHERLAREMAEYAHLKLVEPPVPLRAVVETMYWNPRHEDDAAHRWLRSLIVDIARVHL